jgi:hypothetical protein
MKPSIGRIVIFTLAQSHVDQIKDQRARNDGRLRGNGVVAGEQYPMIISRVWPEETYPGGMTVNGQLILDGNDSLWLTSVHESETGDPGTYSWPRSTQSPSIATLLEHARAERFKEVIKTFVGASTVEEMEQMKKFLETIPGMSAERPDALSALQVLIDDEKAIQAR